MELTSILFYVLASLALIGSVGVIAVQNPIYAALFLVTTMISVAGLFFTLQAYFIAGVQLIVYAGAVMVLFVMVIMLFDLNKEEDSQTSPISLAVMKALGAGAVLGLLMGGFEVARVSVLEGAKTLGGAAAVKEVAVQLFTKNIFAFEIISVLILLVAVGAVTLAKTRGGTHA